LSGSLTEGAMSAALSDLREREEELRRLELELLEQQEAALAAEERKIWGQHAISRERGWFWAFFRWAWPIVEPATPLIELDANRLMCNSIEAVLERRTQFLCIEVPTGSNKSMIGNTMPTPAHWLHRPWDRFLHCSGTDKVNKDNSHRARLILRHPEYQALSDAAASLHGHAPWRLLKGADEKLDYENDHRGQRFALAFGGNLTGPRADFLMLDDLMQAGDFEGDFGAVERRTETKYRRMTNALFSRRNKKATDPIVHVAQALGVGDIGDRWRKAEPELTLCKLAMEFNPDDPENHPDDWRTERGQLLCPEFVPRKVVERDKRTMSAHAFEAQFNQRRIPPEGRMFTEGMLSIQYKGEPRRELGVFVMLVADFAFKDGRKNDDVAVGVIAVKGRVRYHLERRIGKMDVVASAVVMESLVARWQPHLKLYEDKANGPAVARLLRDRVPGLEPFDPKDSKPARLSVLAIAHREGTHVYPEARHAPWLATYQRHCLNAPFGKPVDAADAAAMGEIWLQANPWAGASEESGGGWY